MLVRPFVIQIDKPSPEYFVLSTGTFSNFDLRRVYRPYPCIEE
jgi:hypothetical protein